mgnify:CR=1 FL=1|nr:MAG TPA: Selenium binding protein [Caudoviricetes sp.]
MVIFEAWFNNLYGMKKIFLLIISLFVFTSCAVYMPTPKSFVEIVDYSTLTKQGIFVTESNSVNFSYEPIGSIVAEETGGWSRKDDRSNIRESKDDYYVGSMSKKVYRAPDVQMAFANLASRLHEIDANGVINLKIASTMEFDQASKLSVQKITVTGMAIRK